MKQIFALLILALFLSSCNVTETIVFNEDGSGEFLVSYDMGEVLKQMEAQMGGDVTTDEKKEPGKKMDTLMVFSEIMEMAKDSVALLPEANRLALEAVKDMYMEMHMDEDAGVFDFGIGMKFKTIEDLKGIQEKVKQAQSLNAQSGQVEAMKSGSPFGKFMGESNDGVVYNYTANGFSRVTPDTKLEDMDEDMDALFDPTDPSDQEFMTYFENAFYNVKLVFPKTIKSTNIEGATISEDGKSVTYKVNWLDFIKDPKQLDIDVKFANE